MNRKIITPEISINKRIYKKKQLTKLLFVLFLDFLICLMNKLTRIKEGKNTRCRHVMQFTPKSKRKTRNRQHYLSLLVSSSFSFAKLVFSLFCRGLSGEPNAVCWLSKNSRNVQKKRRVCSVWNLLAIRSLPGEGVNWELEKLEKLKENKKRNCFTSFVINIWSWVFSR